MKGRKFISLTEAAKMCGVSRRTIYYWINHKYIEVYHLPSGSPRVDITELIKKGKNNRMTEIYKENLKKKEPL